MQRPGFVNVKMQPDETFVIGPMRQSSSFNVSGGQGQQAQKVNITVIAITSQRVIVEDVDTPRNTKIVDNADVKRVYIKRGSKGTRVEKVETAAGSVNVGLGWLNPQMTAMLYKLFPNAEIGRKKGLFGGFAKIAAPAAVATTRLQPASQRAAPKPKAAKSRLTKSKGAKPKKSGYRPPPAEAKPAHARSHISDPDVKTVDDLRRLYPLPEGYQYVNTSDGDMKVMRQSDQAIFPMLLEEGLLGFDIPVLDNPKRRKKTIEVFRKG